MDDNTIIAECKEAYKQLFSENLEVHHLHFTASVLQRTIQELQNRNGIIEVEKPLAKIIPFPFIYKLIV